MGEVYLAHDSKLGRNVALKLVLGQYTGSPERLQRFAREARAASALNHPNIVTVYDVDVDGDTQFIATEFVEGETLRTRLQRGRVPLAEALRIATQVADALAAAHRGGIVHRDVKPENILLRPDGYVKVVDFGLAKLVEPAADPERLETRTAMETSVGVVVGTVAYMSPEQARALPVDARTDIWSLGVVLYEMIAGRRPFEGATSSDVIALILQWDPPKLGALAAEASGDVEHVVETALAKDADDRCQSARELVNVLKRVQRQLGGGAETARPLAGAPTAHRRTALGVMLAFTLILAGAAGYHAYRHLLRDRTGEPAPSFEHFQIARLTTSNRVLDAAISPDGRYVVHSVDDGPGQSLRVRHVNTSSNVEIVPTANVAYIGMTFSRDGDYVYYVSREFGGGVASLYRIAVLGGPATKVMENVDTSITFSPDGTRLAFIRGYPDGSTSVVVSGADGTGQRRLATLQPPAGFATGGVEPIGPAWSPDGKTIAAAIEEAGSAGRQNPIGIVDVNSGAVTSLSSRSWYMVRRLAWLADNTGLLAAAADKSSAYSAQQVWRIPYPTGEPRPITRDLSNYRGVSMTAAGRALLAVQTSTTAGIWVARREDPSAASIVTPSRTTFDGRFGLSWTPGGEIVYSSAANGTYDLWIMKADGSGRRPIATEAGADVYPDVSRDGRTVVMTSDRGSGIFDIWQIGIDGSGIRPLTREGAWFPKTLPDGSVLYSSGYSTWRVSPGGGAPSRVTQASISRPSVSPDGTRFVCNYRESVSARAQLAVYHIGEASPRTLFDIPATADSQVQWGPDGQSLHYIDTREGVSNIWSLSLNGGAATQVTRFKTDRIFAFAWSRDGTKLALSRGSVDSDAVLITSER